MYHAYWVIWCGKADEMETQMNGKLDKIVCKIETLDKMGEVTNVEDNT